MSLVCPVGPEGNLLSDPAKEHCARLNVRHPVLTLDEMETLKNKVYVDKDGNKAFSTHVIDCTFPAGSGPDGMLQVSSLLVVFVKRKTTDQRCHLIHPQLIINIIMVGA